MLMPLHRVIIFVGDVQKCAEFYGNAFGFKTVPSDLPIAEWAELDTGGCRLAFHQAHGPNGPIKSSTGSQMNPHKIVFHAQDVDAARADLVSKGANMGQIKRFGPLVMCDGQDPEGHVFQISNRP